MSYRAIFLDIDGTIIKPDHTYDASTKEAIRQAKAAGIEVFLCTGRPLMDIVNLTNDFGITSSITYNGSYAMHENEMIFKAAMRKEDVERMISISCQGESELALYTTENNYFTSLKDAHVIYFSKVSQMKEFKLFTEDVADQIVAATAINVFDSKGDFSLIEGYQLSKVNIKHSTESYDLIRTSVNKGEAVKKMIAHLNLSPSEVIAFGDGMNDKEMLQFAGAGVAMGNADSMLVPYADFQTTTVEENGIFNGLKKLGVVN
ncbi:MULTISPECIES: HAD family hydrolase [Oceanobacillus]|uniref:HAD family hydrolase n=1 Tax=Oceanobacillus aidingensis TaxID=645964 RepID=A0ABV9JWT7_9BACI|nr:HAD family hydrolase [Oceanobacillus oncorhynchi]MDM8100093.1 HAD family hydrolase [Oceanobacillus oncorhynchi]